MNGGNDDGDLTAEQLAALDELFEEEAELTEAASVGASEPTTAEQREIDQQAAFQQLHGEDEVDAEENAEYLEQRHKEARDSSS
jgi:hypothetical protein